MESSPRASGVVEVPPLGAQRFKARPAHDLSQKPSIASSGGANLVLCYELIFDVNVSSSAQIVNAGAHVKSVASKVAEGDVYGETIVV